MFLNPFSTIVPLLYPLKTENLRSSDAFGGYRMKHWLKMGKLLCPHSTLSLKKARLSLVKLMLREIKNEINLTRKFIIKHFLQNNKYLLKIIHKFLVSVATTYLQF